MIRDPSKSIKIAEKSPIPSHGVAVIMDYVLQFPAFLVFVVNFANS